MREQKIREAIRKKCNQGGRVSRWTTTKKKGYSQVKDNIMFTEIEKKIKFQEQKKILLLFPAN